MFKITPTYAWPNLSVKTGEDRNPANLSARMGTAPAHLPVDPKLSFADVCTTCCSNRPCTYYTIYQESFPKLSLSFYKLLENIHETQVDSIMRRSSETLLLLPADAGWKFYKENPNTPADIADFINNLNISHAGIEDEAPPSDVLVIAPTPATKLNTKRKNFAAPWPLIAQNIRPEVRTWLLWQQTVTCTPKISFHVITAEPNISWSIMTVSAQGLVTEARKDGILLDIKKALCQNNFFCRDSNFLVRRKGSQNTTDQSRVIEAMSTWSLTFIELRDDNDRVKPVFHLMGEPLTTDPVEHEKWLATIRKTP
jgi:hypothetical protein